VARQKRDSIRNSHWLALSSGRSGCSSVRTTKSFYRGTASQVRAASSSVRATTSEVWTMNSWIRRFERQMVLDDCALRSPQPRRHHCELCSLRTICDRDSL